MSYESVFLGKDNTVNVVLSNNGVPIDHTTITRATISLDSTGTVIDSSITPGVFIFTDATKLIMKLGLAALPAGRYWATLTVWLPGNTDGLVWAPTLLLEIA